MTNLFRKPFFYLFMLLLAFAFVATSVAQVRKKGITKTPAVKKISLPPIKGEAKNSRTNSIGMELIYIPAGEFLMGLNEADLESSMIVAREFFTAPTTDSFTNAFPQHRKVFKEGFWMGKYEVTQAQWKTIMGTTISQQHAKAKTYTGVIGEGPNYPMYYVSWYETQEFIKKLNERNDGFEYRLPSEAEWEYAHRAGTFSLFSGPENLDATTWYGKNSADKTHPVGQKQPNAWGLFDMDGNVDEWCEDLYRANYTEEAPILGWKGDPYRVQRGGSWLDKSRVYFLASNRGYSLPNVTSYATGFRVVAITK